MTTPTPSRLSAAELIDLVLDEGSWRSWDVAPDRTGVSPEYAAELAAAQEKSGCDESVLTGEGLMKGRRVAVVMGEFAFLAGSIGRAAADRLVSAIERATSEGLPLLAGPVSGGTRMQEGTPAFVQMVRITAAVAAHKAAGLPYLVYLRHPTTGGVMASWGSLGHVTVAEPGALIGFLGPRVYQALYGKPFPEGVQTAENLYARGIVDAVLPPEEIAGILDRALRILLAPRHGIRPVPDPVPLSEFPDVVDLDVVRLLADLAGVRQEPALVQVTHPEWLTAGDDRRFLSLEGDTPNRATSGCLPSRSMRAVPRSRCAARAVSRSWLCVGPPSSTPSSGACLRGS